ncbi:MAG TPA: tetratricopeptide repeat protein [Acidobacteriaceae bacterium]
MTEPLRKRHWIPWALAAIAAVFLVYSNSFHNGFHFDDYHTVTDNPAIRSLSNVPRFFTDASTFSVLPANRTYRPAVSFSLALDYALGHGYTPFWFHAGTFVLFLLLLASLFLLYDRLLHAVDGSAGNVFLALIAAAWFGLHPAIAETVNYIIQRGDLYCTLGCVAALAIYARLPRYRSTGLYLLPLAFALLSKPPAAVFPVLLFFYVYFFESKEGTGRWKSALLATLPSLVLTGSLMLLQSGMTPKTFMPSQIPAWDYRLTQGFVWLRYFGALFLPIHLNVDSDLPAFATFDLRAFAGLLFVAALVTGIFLTARRRVLYPIAYGLIWFVVTQLPTSLYPLSEMENDHRMFFSFAGLILAVVWAAALLLRRLLSAERIVQLRPALIALVVVMLGAYGWGTHLRNRVWGTDETLWLDDVQKSPHNGRGLMNYGLVLMAKGNYAEALDYFKRAFPLTPNYPSLEINMGIATGAMGHAGEAQTHFERAIALAPNGDEAHAFYGRWLMEQGRLTEAITQLRTAVQLNPARPFQQNLLVQAIQSATSGQTAQATVQSESAASLINRSLALNQAGKFAESIATAKQALKLDPRSALAWNNIAAGYEGMRQWDPAIDAARHALSLQPDFQLAKNNLAWSESQKKQKAQGKP